MWSRQEQNKTDFGDIKNVDLHDFFYRPKHRVFNHFQLTLPETEV